MSIWRYHLKEARKLGPSDWEGLPIHLGAQVDRTSSDGIAVGAVVPDENLTRDVLVSFVRRFWSAREQGFQEPPDWSGRQKQMEVMLEETIDFYARMDEDARQAGLLV